MKDVYSQVRNSGNATNTATARAKFDFSTKSGNLKWTIDCGLLPLPSSSNQALLRGKNPKQPGFYSYKDKFEAVPWKDHQKWYLRPNETNLKIIENWHKDKRIDGIQVPMGWMGKWYWIAIDIDRQNFANNPKAYKEGRSEEIEAAKKNMENAIAGWIEKNPPIALAPRYQTQGGGLRFLFRSNNNPEDDGWGANNQFCFDPNSDKKGIGEFLISNKSLIIIPPSIGETGNEYEWIVEPSPDNDYLPPLIESWKDLGIHKFENENQTLFQTRTTTNPTQRTNTTTTQTAAAQIKPKSKAARPNYNNSNKDGFPLILALPQRQQNLYNSPPSEGNRNNAAAAIARALLGAERALNRLGQRYSPSAELAFTDFCDRCIPSLSNDESRSIWQSAVRANPEATLSEETIQKRIDKFYGRSKNKKKGKKPKGATSIAKSKLAKEIFANLGFNEIFSWPGHEFEIDGDKANGKSPWDENEIFTVKQNTDDEGVTTYKWKTKYKGKILRGGPLEYHYFIKNEPYSGEIPKEGIVQGMIYFYKLAGIEPPNYLQNQTLNVPEYWGEVAIAELLSERYRSKLAWNSQIQEWVRYSAEIDGIWSREPQEFVARVIKVEIQNLAECYAELTEAEEPITFSFRFLNDVLKLIKVDLAIKKWNEADGLLPLQNGILDLESRELKPHAPGYRLTWCVPYDYIPGAGCEPIVDWMYEMCDFDENTVDLLRAYLYGILTSRTDWQQYLELIGPGGTGKGTFIRLATALVGFDNTHATKLSKLESNRFETASIAGKRLVIIGDSDRYGGSVDILKSLTGEDSLPYEEKFKQSTGGFFPDAMVIVAANEPIQSSDYTSGLERRRISVPMTKQIPKNKRKTLIKYRKGKILGEFAPYLPGFLNWVLEFEKEEASEIVKNYLEKSTKLQEMKAQILLDSNPMADWLNNNVIYRKDARTNIGSCKLDGSEIDNTNIWLYPNYVNYCREAGNKSVALRRFGNLLHDLCKNQLKLEVEKSRDRNGAYFAGLEIRNNDFHKDIEPLIPSLIVKPNSSDVTVKSSDAIASVTVKSEDVTIMVTDETLTSDGCDGCDGKIILNTMMEVRQETTSSINASDSNTYKDENLPSHPSPDFQQIAKGTENIELQPNNLPSPISSQPDNLPSGFEQFTVTSDKFTLVNSHPEVEVRDEKSGRDREGFYKDSSVNSHPQVKLDNSDSQIELDNSDVDPLVNGYPQVKLDNSDPQSGSRRWRARKSQENKLGTKTAHDDAIEQLAELLAKVENITELAQLKQREIYNPDRAKAATKQLPISQQRKICEMAIELNEIATRANSLLSRLTARPNEFKTVEEVSLFMDEVQQLYDSNYKMIETIISGYCEQVFDAYSELIDSLS